MKNLTLSLFFASLIGGIAGGSLVWLALRSSINNAPTAPVSPFAGLAIPQAAPTPEIPMGAIAKSIRKECGPEVDRFCATVKPGKMALRNCLLDHRTELSPSCVTHLQQITFPDADSSK